MGVPFDVCPVTVTRRALKVPEAGRGDDLFASKLLKPLSHVRFRQPCGCCSNADQNAALPEDSKIYLITWVLQRETPQRIELEQVLISFGLASITECGLSTAVSELRSRCRAALIGNAHCCVLFFFDGLFTAVMATRIVPETVSPILVRSPMPPVR